MMELQKEEFTAVCGQRGGQQACGGTVRRKVEFWSTDDLNVDDSPTGQGLVSSECCLAPCLALPLPASPRHGE
ncbi:hypothetical protein O3P69_004185 [Scylla paramamosain]|uniref:Uncharacterized protein n=1 Tax=Scylla paramamosain TaxID=85552 RepID=A0AAW0UJA2_SCYPA